MRSLPVARLTKPVLLHPIALKSFIPLKYSDALSHSSTESLAAFALLKAPAPSSQEILIRQIQHPHATHHPSN
jgi:hypothetical protein